MIDLSTIAVLQHNALFRGLPATTLDALAGLALRRKHLDGSVIFSQGDAGNALYGVASGRVRLSSVDADGREIFLSIMDSGDIFGEIGAIDGLPRTAGATAVQPSTLVVIRRAPLLAQLKNDPELAIHFLDLLCGRLRQAIELVEDSVFLTTPARIAKRIISLIEIYGHKIDANSADLRISQSELAHFLGVSRQMINGCLQAWRKAGLVEPGRSHVVVRNLAALRRLAVETHAATDYVA